MEPARGRRALALALVGFLALSGALSVPARAAEPLRILLYGDSVTQGSSGDWTWRYRLWSHLTASGTAVDMVGPRSDLWSFVGNAGGSVQYADPKFDTDHAAVWGTTFSSPTDDFSQSVLTAQADVAVGLIGLNDLLYGLLTPTGLADRWRTEITQTRADAPATVFVLVKTAQTWYGGVDEYNTLLDALAAELDTPDSRVVSTAVPSFSAASDTFDGTHPSAAGEVKIAAAVSDALAGLGLGTAYPRPLYLPAPGPIWAPVPAVSATPTTITVGWPSVDYADKMVVHVRDVTADTRMQSQALSGQSWLALAQQGHTYAVRLQPVKYWLASATRSSAVHVRAPARPSAPRNVSVDVGTRGRARVSWTAPAYATAYRLRLRNITADGRWHPVGSLVTAIHIGLDRLRQGLLYAVRVRAFGPLAGELSSPFRFRYRP